MRVRVPVRRSSLPALAAAVLFAVAGCGSGGESGASGGSGEAGTAAGSSPEAGSGDEPADGAGTDGGTEGGDANGSAEVPDAFRFTGQTLDGQKFDGAELAGKPTVLWFWAPWCPKCKAQGPETAKVAQEFEGKAHVVGVAGLDKPAAMKDFVSSAKVGGFPQLNDEPGALWRKFGVTEQSVYVVLDGKGKTVFTGNLPAGEGLAGKVRELVG
ncbi:redoxin domain-containing protein [Streptomyces sp. WAC 00631]|uniref:redoxin domain-containing protein n=1 Tax=unclassified Streptomyces TaxID=2593676 RepID=UPI000F778CFF|nr:MULTISPECIES: redoxin domain-containing protein [unclassified Streptomyces]MCC5032252.1 redoxin domain-containing protein [Streptomyces sp. WAC 00631]MCC9740363.1 redoxin domain-containing protein [Streptomyces sp. MNU89]